MPTRRILLIAHLAPPSPLSAARRVAGLTRYLAGLGHEVTVLTSVLSGRGPIAGAARVVRARDLLAGALNWRRGNFAALEGEAGAEYSPPSRVATWLVPDPVAVSWAPFATARALRLAGRCDCAITSGPARSTHLVGLALSRRGVPWIAEFRDGWRFEDQRPPWGAPPLDRLDRALERRVVRAADLCIAVTEPIAEDLRRRFSVAAETVTNGFDPDDPDLRAGSGPLPVTPGRHAVVHTGSLEYGGRDPEPVLAALWLLRQEDPEAAGRLEVLFAGPISAAERRRIERAGLDGQVRALGPLPRPEALALQRAAGTLLLLTGDEQTSVATGKLYEYLAAGRPILVLGERSEAARLVRDAGAGLATSARAPERIAAALRELLTRADVPRDPAAVERYAYPRLAERLAALVERAIDARALR